MNFRRIWRMCPGRWFLPVNVPQWIWWFCEMNSWVSWILQVLFHYMERWRKYHRYSVDIAVIRRVGRYALSQGAFPQVLPWKGWRKTVLLLYPWRFRRSGDSVHHWIENCFCAKQVSGAQGVFCISVWNQVDVWWDFERLRLGLPCLVCLCIVTLRPVTALVRLSPPLYLDCSSLWWQPWPRPPRHPLVHPSPWNWTSYRWLITLTLWIRALSMPKATMTSVKDSHQQMVTGNRLPNVHVCLQTRPSQKTKSSSTNGPNQTLVKPAPRLTRTYATRQSVSHD